MTTRRSLLPELSLRTRAEALTRFLIRVKDSQQQLSFQRLPSGGSTNHGLCFAYDRFGEKYRTDLSHDYSGRIAWRHGPESCWKIALHGLQGRVRGPRESATIFISFWLVPHRSYGNTSGTSESLRTFSRNAAEKFGGAYLISWMRSKVDL